MNTFKEIKPEDLDQSAFRLIGTDWMLLTAEKDRQVNTMTASWGGFGVMFHRNVTYTVVRPQRFTKEFIEHADTFSLTFFDKSFKKQLSYLGSVSGKDEDKIAKAELTVQHSGSTPYFAEAKLVIICRKLYAQEFNSASFLASGLDEKFYPLKDYHTLYISEVEKILIKD
ncbi:MAG: flavin reductase [Gorillibacterium sp.]|nr:flavin reductase [Gorillibacterium sp.]